MPVLVLASECMTRAVMASRLPRWDAAWRETDVVARAEVEGVEAEGGSDLVATVLAAGFELELGLRVFFALVLKGLATGARVGSDFEAGVDCIAAVERLTETVSRRSAVERRWNNIYCTPMGLLALSCRVWETTDGASRDWRLGCGRGLFSMYRS